MSREVIDPSRLPTLRTWQEDALLAWQKAGFKGTFEVATGGGKTTFALAAFAKFQILKPGTKAVVVVPSVALLDQWFVAVQEEIGVAESDIKVLSTRDLKASHLVNLVVINSARHLSEDPSRGDRVMQIVDECHRAGSIQNRGALLPSAAAAMGLSATPFREFDSGFEAYVQPSLGPIVFQYTLADAIRDGVLAGLKLMYVRIPLTQSESKAYRSLSGQIARAYKASASLEVVERLLRKRARLYNNAAHRIPTMVRLMERYRGRRTIVFVESIEAASLAHQLLARRGHAVATYHSGMGEHIRRSNLRNFRRGLFDVLVACRALDEGFNVPEAEIAMVVAGTAARRQRIQRVGRVLRALEGKEHAEVITLYATSVEEQRLLAEASEFPQEMARWVEGRVGG